SPYPARQDRVANCSGGAGPAPLGVLVDSVQVGAQQFDQELVPFGEAAAVTAQEQAEGSAGRGGQASDNLVLHAEATQVLGVHRRAVPLPLRIEVRGLGHGLEVAAALGVAAG